MVSVFILCNSIVLFFVVSINITFALNLQEILDFKDPDVQEFSNLITKHHRRHRFKIDDAGEVKRRLGHFRKSKDLIQRFRNKHKNAKFRLNKFSLMSKEEKQQHFGVVLSNRAKSRATRSA
uniref:Cathepsin propeptide inhibitor domain-containing protein n=1 Tax=Panagrolaimus sp. PS1159 TaxID=55785 RepID=A0AC35EQN3_9BILA